MVARSPPPSLRMGWLEFEFSLAGQTNHWSLNGLPWQITPHSCPPTVEIKLCPVSASFVFSSLCLFPSPPFSAHILLFLKLWRPHKGAQLEEAFKGVGIHAKKIQISLLTIKLTYIPPQKKHTSCCKLMHLHTYHTYTYINTGKSTQTEAALELFVAALLGLRPAALVAPASCFVYLGAKLFVLWSKWKANTPALPVMCEHAGNVPHKAAKQLDPLAVTSWRRVRSHCSHAERAKQTLTWHSLKAIN